MDKALDLHTDFSMNPSDLLQRQFSGRYHTAGSHLFKKRGTFRPSNGHLGTGMNIQIWKMFPDIGKHTHILNNHRIQSCHVIRI